MNLPEMKIPTLQIKWITGNCTMEVYCVCKSFSLKRKMKRFIDCHLVNTSPFHECFNQSLVSGAFIIIEFIKQI